VYKHLLLAAFLSAPCLAFAGQAMSVDECSTVASNAATGAADTVMSSMHDVGSASAAHVPAARGVDETETHARADTSAAHASSAVQNASGDTTTRPHKGGGHGRAPWQSLLPGVMK
jgi:hypothetical protein